MTHYSRHKRNTLHRWRRPSRFLVSRDSIGLYWDPSYIMYWDLANAKVTRDRVDITGIMSINQYKALWNEKPALWQALGGSKYKNMMSYRINSVIRSTSKTLPKKGLWYFLDLPSFRRMMDARIIFWSSTQESRLFHNYSNIDWILYYIKKLRAKASDVLFDGECMIEADKDMFDTFSVRSDAVITKWNTIVFLETDMGTHTFDTLKKKALLYKKIIESGSLQKMGYENIRIAIYSYSRRIHGIEKNKCFDPIEKYIEFLDFLDNPYGYFPQGDTGFPDHDAFLFVEKFLKKITKRWSEDVSMMKKTKRKIFRDGRHFDKEISRAIIERRENLSEKIKIVL